MERLNKDVKIFACDFETITENRMELNNLDDTDVHLWRVVNIYDEHEHYEGTCIDTFMKFMLESGGSKLLYFHNLGYDGSYIIPSLFDYKLTFINHMSKNEKRYNIFNIFQTPTGRKIYSMKIRYRTKKLGKKTITIYDSLAILNSSIDTLGKSLGMEKHNDHTKKSGFYDIDPTWYKKDYMDAPELWREYIERDTIILARSLVKYFDSIIKIQEELGINKKYISSPQKILTIGSMFNTITKNYMYLIKMNYKRDCRTTLEDYGRASIYYNGGLTTFNKDYHIVGDITNEKMKRFVKKHEKGIGLDINSSYPHQMTKPLPYGKLKDGPHRSPKQEGIKYYTFYKIRFSSCLIREKYKGFVCLKNNCSWYEGVDKKRKHFGDTHKLYISFLHPKANKEKYEMYYLKCEWDIISQIYEFKDVEVIVDFHFKAKPYLKNLIDEIYKVRLDCKSKDDKAGVHNYKILMNSGYGKFASKPEFDTIHFASDDEIEDIIDNGLIIEHYGEKSYHYTGDIMENRVGGMRGIKLKRDIPAVRIVNVAIGAVITALARTQLMSETKKYMDLGCKFVYGDTDSIYFIAPKELEITTDEINLGGWKLEKRFVGIFVDRAKRYSWIEVDENGKETRINKCAGVGINATNDEMWNVDIIEQAKLARKFSKTGKIILTSRDIILSKENRMEEINE
ncbi:MAG: DNA polymerase [Mycoplasmoidaceae bacterium]